jgi:hypothetical protein
MSAFEKSGLAVREMFSFTLKPAAAAHWDNEFRIL